MKYFYLFVIYFCFSINGFAQNNSAERRIVFLENGKFIPITMLVHCPYFWMFDFMNIEYGHKKIEREYDYYMPNPDNLNKQIFTCDTFNKIDTVKSYFVDKGDLCHDTGFSSIKRKLLYSILLNDAHVSNIYNDTIKKIRIVFPQNFDRKYFYIVTINIFSPDSIDLDYIITKSNRIDKYDVISKFSFNASKKVVKILNKKLSKIEAIISSIGCLSDSNHIETESLFESSINEYKYNFITLNSKNNKTMDRTIRNYFRFIEFIRYLPYEQGIKMPVFK